jgi:ribosomal protein S18 acetylase RimI-like enzyme
MDVQRGPAMAEPVLMAADAEAVAGAGLEWPRWRPMERTDLEWHADLSWMMHPHAPPYDSPAAHLDLTRSAFDGEWGEVWHDASPVALSEDGERVGTVLVLRSLDRPGAPDGAYVLNCMVEPAWKRRGIAEGLMIASACVIANAAEQRIALSVDAQNEGAIALYRKLGFEELAQR